MDKEKAISSFFKEHTWLFSLICALVVGLPFLNKAFHIDDSFYLKVIDQIIKNPLRPFDAAINWNGHSQHMFEVNTNPPLLDYFLAPLVRLFGHSEIALHLGMLFFLILLVKGAMLLSERFTHGSFWPVLFVLLSPAIVVSGNIMPDIPMVSLLTLSIALWIKGVDEDKPTWLLLSSILAGCTPLTKYSGAIVFPVIAFYSISRGKLKSLFALIPGCLVFGAWMLHNFIFYGTTHLHYLMEHKRTSQIWHTHFAAGIIVIGSCLWLFPLMLVGLAKRHIKSLFFILPILPLCGLFIYKKYAGFHSYQHIIWGTAGGGLLWSIVVLFFQSNAKLVHFKNNKLKRTQFLDDCFLLIFSGIVIYFSSFYVMFQAVRHLIPAMLPLTLLAFRLLRRYHPLQTTLSKTLLGCLLIIQGIVAFWAGIADYGFCSVYRDFAKRHIPPLINQHKTVWFVGSWGWQYYATKACCNQVSTQEDRPKQGDIVLIPDRIHKNFRLKGLKYKELQTIDYKNNFSLFTVRDRNSACFYALKGNCIPFLFLKDTIFERFHIREVI